MAIEILDRGACQVAGHLSMALAPAVSTFVGKGVSAFEHISEALILTLDAPIAEVEFLALRGERSSPSGDQEAFFVWIDPTHIGVVPTDFPAEGVPIEFDLMFFRIDGRASFEATGYDPPVPP